MNRSRKEEVIVTDLKRFAFIAVFSTLTLYLLESIAQPLPIAGYLAVYCPLSIVSVYIFRARWHSQYTLVIFIAFGLLLAVLRGANWTLHSADNFLGFLIIVVLAAGASLAVIVLDVILSHASGR